MGDDSLEDYVDGAAEAYRKMGIHVKFYTKCTDEFCFCSQTFRDGIAFPSTPGKMTFNLVQQGGEQSQKLAFFQQWAFEMRHSPDHDRWVAAIERSGWAAQRDGRKDN